MKHLFYLVCITTFIFTSCSKDTDINGRQLLDKDANIRSVNNLNVVITKSDRTIVTLNASKITATYLSNDLFTLVVNQGTEYTQVFTAFATVVSDPESHLKVVKNPGANQTVYLNKNNLSISANAANNLLVNIQPGNISTTAVSIVGDESEGL